MSKACLCRGIVTLAQFVVKSRRPHAPILTCPACSAPASDDFAAPVLSWREVADFRERLLGIPADRAIGVISVLQRAVVRKIDEGGSR